MLLRAGVVGLLAFCSSAVAAPADSVPDPEVAATVLAVKLPALPSFDLPPTEPGFVTPRHLRVQGKPLLGTKVQAKGYVIWVYDCIDAERKAGESRAQVQKRIDEDPTQCERRKLYLGERKDTALERGLWVVDVPRPPNKLEKERLSPEDLAKWPAVPMVKVGDHVVITGTFALESPHSERNSDGLLVFESITAAKPSKPLPATVSPNVADEKPSAVAIPPPPARPPVDPKVVNISNLALNAGNRAYSAGDFAEAVKQYKRAITAWDGNHLAYYGLGGALAGQGDWKQASAAFRSAVAIRPDSSMYQMWCGIAHYEAVAADAKKAGVDLSTTNLDTARGALEIALAIEPALWRANYYLGRIYRAAGNMRVAARYFGGAITNKPTEQGPYIALAELYRKWDYAVQAIAVAKLGTAHVPPGDSASDVWFVLGMAYDDRRDFLRAIPAFTRALDLKSDNHKARFQRGQAYYKLKKHKQAKTDLDMFVQNGIGLEFAKRQAHKMLLDLAGHGAK